MKTLTLLRHGKSNWDDRALRDFDRPLNERGRTASALMGKEAARRGLTFDQVVASPARRTAETIARFKEAYGQPLKVEFIEAVYAASSLTLLEVIQAAAEGISSLLIVGHNPGLEELAAELAENWGRPQHFPTAALCRLSLPAGNWTEVRAGSAAVDFFLRPKDLAV